MAGSSREGHSAAEYMELEATGSKLQTYRRAANLPKSYRIELRPELVGSCKQGSASVAGSSREGHGTTRYMELEATGSQLQA